MLSLIKQYFCRHADITTKTESWSPDHCFIVKSLIQCNSCKKTFPQHPNAKCCHVEHIHSQLLFEYWMEKLRSSQQCQQHPQPQPTQS